MLNFTNSGKGAGIGSMFTKDQLFEPTYLWSFIGAPVPANGTQGTVLIVNDLKASISLNYTNSTTSASTIIQSTNTISIGQPNGLNGKLALFASLPTTLKIFTFSIWAKIFSVNSLAQRLLELSDDSGNFFFIDALISRSNPVIGVNQSGISIYGISLLNNLQHICITVNGINYTVYINGVSVLSNNTFPSNGMNSFTIANNNRSLNNNGRGCQCTVADVRIYNTVLTQGQITALYNANQAINADTPLTNFIKLY
jgi:hypothetical protein